MKIFSIANYSYDHEVIKFLQDNYSFSSGYARKPNHFVFYSQIQIPSSIEDLNKFLSTVMQKLTKESKMPDSGILYSSYSTKKEFKSYEEMDEFYNKLMINLSKLLYYNSINEK